METRTEPAREALLADLTKPQREAVEHTDGPLLILAGPGSGKTRVVTRRAAHLACTVTEPRHILAITFTNKAAREMQERIGRLAVADGMTVSTFHALCARLLREYAESAGVPRNFTIFDRDDRRKVIKQAMTECDLSSENFTPRSVEHEISLAKNNLLTPATFGEAHLDWRRQTVARIFRHYEELLQRFAGLDFDDLLTKMVGVLESCPECRDDLEGRYRYVLVDEYQDTNLAQYRIARLLTERHRNLCATGDPDQSIYGWRGANLENILRFEHDFPEARVVFLDQNYRSTKRILSAADRLIAENLQRKERTLWTNNDDGVSVRILECETEKEEAQAIAGDIVRRLEAGVPAADLALFYRVNSLSRAVEDALIRHGIAYQIARGVEFYGRKEIKDVLAYLRVLINPADDVSLLRIINTPPRGIGATTLKRMVQQARAAKMSLYDLLTGRTAGREAPFSSLGRSAGKVQAFANLLQELRDAVHRPPVDALSQVMSHSGLRALYAHQGDVEDEAARNLDELLNAAADFENEHPDGTLIDWLEHTALVSDVDSVRDETAFVTLMTLHAAKGLEFAEVYLVGVEDGLLPMKRLDDERVDLEEERRLLFVGMTRAKKRLTLSHARYRMIRGSARRTTRSPFVGQLPPDQVVWESAGTSETAASTSVYRGFPDDVDPWEIGTIVRHPLYGVGRIMGVQRLAERPYVDVLFRNAPRQKFALEYAELERVDFDELGDTTESTELES